MSEEWIKHLQCGMTSHNRNDVRERYCAYCHRWLRPGEYEVRDADKDKQDD